MKHNLKKFIKMAQADGRLIGCQSDFEETISDLETGELDVVDIEFSDVGQTAARLYWQGFDFRGDKIGGCISIPNATFPA